MQECIDGLLDIFDENDKRENENIKYNLIVLLLPKRNVMTIGTISIIIGAVLLVLLKLFIKDEESSGHKKRTSWGRPRNAKERHVI